MRTFVRTFTGKELDLLRPNPKDICIEDIAHHLAKLERYNGAGAYPYSVGQHSLFVAEILPPEYMLHGLLHDATEAYLGDVVSPLKQLLPEYKKIEQGIMAAVFTRFNLSFPRQDIIKQADKSVMAAEMHQVLGWPDLPAKQGLPAPPKGLIIRPLGWEDVKQAFTARFNALHTHTRTTR